MQKQMRTEKTNNSATPGGLSAESQIMKSSRSEPMLNQRAPEVQKFGEIFRVPLGIPEEAIKTSITTMNQVLVESFMIREMYKKHHWQVAGPTFYQLHLLLDKHFEQQVELVDLLAERIQSLGGIAISMPHDVAELTTIERPPRGREEVPVQLSRLMEAHEIILKMAHKGAKLAGDAGDDGTNDLLVSNIIRTNELQAWFISEHLVALPTVKADQGGETATGPRALN